MAFSSVSCCRVAVASCQCSLSRFADTGEMPVLTLTCRLPRSRLDRLRSQLVAARRTSGLRHSRPARRTTDETLLWALAGVPCVISRASRPYEARSVVHSTTGGASRRSISAPMISFNCNCLAAACARTTPASVLRSVTASACDAQLRRAQATARRDATPLPETKSSSWRATPHSAAHAQARRAGGSGRQTLPRNRLLRHQLSSLTQSKRWIGSCMTAPLAV